MAYSPVIKDTISMPHGDGAVATDGTYIYAMQAADRYYLAKYSLNTSTGELTATGDSYNVGNYIYSLCYDGTYLIVGTDASLFALDPSDLSLVGSAYTSPSYPVRKIQWNGSYYTVSELNDKNTGISSSRAVSTLTFDGSNWTRHGYSTSYSLSLLSNDSSYLYAYASNVLSKIDVSSGVFVSVDSSITIGSAAYDLAFDSSGNIIVARSGGVYLIDTSDMSNPYSYTTGSTAYSCIYDGTYYWVTNVAGGKLTLLDSTLSLATSVALDGLQSNNARSKAMLNNFWFGICDFSLTSVKMELTAMFSADTTIGTAPVTITFTAT